MTGHPVLSLLLAGALGAAAGCAVADDFTPRPQREFTDKPRIEDYADYNAFLVDIMEYRRQKENATNRPQAAKKPADQPAQPLSTGLNVTVDAYGRVAEAADRKLYQIDGPETLDEALKRAAKLPHPVYAEPERFGRSTSFSFPLPQMQADDMSYEDVRGRLMDPEGLEVAVYEDDGATLLSDTVLADNPDNADDTQQQKAADVGNAGVSRSSINLNDRVAYDMDGKRYDLPLVMKNEVDFTVVKLDHLTVDVH